MSLLRGVSFQLLAQAITLAAGLAAVPLISRAVYPLVVASQAIPIVALAPLLLVWFGYGLAPKVIVTTLVAQSSDPWVAAACAAWVHGRAGEIANAGRPLRGVTLADVLVALADAWRLEHPAADDGVLARLPRVGET